MLKKILYILLVTLSASAFSQKGDINTLIEHYTNYNALAAETVFVQLNKSQFFLGENLWFKAYVYDTKTQKPYFKTKNLYASVFDRRGNLMEQKLFLVNDAMTNGDFEIKPNYPPGDYLIKFSTNWMKNFNEDQAVYQTFSILGAMDEDEMASETKTVKDIQFFPEGGHFVSGLMNTVGFKLNDSKGKPIEILSATIFNSKGIQVTQFSSNEMGLGKLQIAPEANETYSVVANLQNGNSIKQAFLKPELKGIAVSINNQNEEQLFVGITTNKTTLPEVLGKNFYLLIHRDGTINKIDFKFASNVYAYTVPISRKLLLSGVNIITLFNDKNQPIFERLIFNKNAALRQNLELTTVSKGVDSTKILLKTNKSAAATISISALPTENDSYDTEHNILNTFLLKPYVKGNIDNADHYFEKDDRKTAYDLDILLLVQGWSKLNWRDVFYSPQKALYNFETGFQIAGKLIDAQKSAIDEIQLFSKNDALLEISKIDKAGYFRFEELSLSDNTEISFTAMNTNGKMVQPKLNYNIYPKNHPDSISKTKISQLIKVKKTAFSSIDVSAVVSDPFETTNMVSLDTINIKNEVKAPKSKVIYGKMDGRYIDLDKTYAPTSRILDVIAYNGFNVYEANLAGGVSILSRRRVSLPSSGSDGSLRTPSVYIDNLELFDLDQLRYMYLADIEDLHISQTPSILGESGRMGGVINIFLKKNFYSKVDTSNNFNSSQINLGFSNAKTYYTPNYDTSNPELLSTYAAVAWLPNLKADHNGQFEFNMVNYNYGDVKLYISGMAQDGSLISEIIPLDKSQATN